MDTGSFDKLINRIIDKRYKIESAVGVGGMAYVLKALDLTDNKCVAIKFLSDEYRDDERAVKRFINESKTVAMLNHDNIVKIHDVVINDEHKYIVMEYIDGITLKDYTDKIGTLSWKEATYYIKQVLCALGHAHEKQVIHRDIKPQNIMLLSDGKVKVTDFGIAKIPNAESITVTDKAIGTVNYISPEQASGAPVDSRTDIYSVGVMLYELVAGRLPFIADSPVAVAMMQVSNEPLSPREINPQIPIGLEQIILKAMQKNPDDRFISAQAMLKALEFFTKNPEVVFAGSATNTGATGTKIKKGEYEDAEKKKQKLKKYIRGSRSMFPIVSGIALSFFVICLAFFMIWVLPSFSGAASFGEVVDERVPGFMDSILGVNDNTDSQKVVVNSFIDRKYNDALVAEMEELGFAVETVNYTRDPRKAANVVVNQKPEADAIRIRQDSESLIPITLYVNMGEEEMVVPDCTLMHINNAKTAITSALSRYSNIDVGLDTIKVVEEYHDTYPADYVIRTEPAANIVVSLSPMPEFTVYVSKGQQLSNTIVPVLEGLTLEQAKRSIVSSKLALGRIYYEQSSSVPTGHIIKASHVAKEVVASGITSVDLWVSTGSNLSITEQPKDTYQEPDVDQPPSRTEPSVEDFENLLNMRENNG